MRRIGFVLLSNPAQPVPSTRVAALNLFPFLRAAGYAPEVLFAPDTPSETPALKLSASAIAQAGHRVVVFQKTHGEPCVQLARELEAHGVRTIYLVCDLVDEAMARATHATIVVTDYLKSLYPAELRHKVHVVHDGIERPNVHKPAASEHRGSRERPLKAVLVTSSALDHVPVIGKLPSWLEVTIVGLYRDRSNRAGRWAVARWQFVEQAGWRRKAQYLRFLADPKIRREAWDADGVYRWLCEADIGIIPIEREPAPSPEMPNPAWMIKSENRLSLKMSVGLPVVATPIPAYEPVVVDGVNGYLARSPAEWIDKLEALRSPEHRALLGSAARRSVLERFSMERQAARFVAVLAVVTT